MFCSNIHLAAWLLARSVCTETYFDGYININGTQFHGGHFCLAKNYDTQPPCHYVYDTIRQYNTKQVYNEEH